MTTVEKIFDLIDKSGIAKKDFAAAIGVTPSTISEWKSERQNPISHIAKIADYFDVSVDYLLGRTDNSKTAGGLDDIPPQELVPLPDLPGVYYKMAQEAHDAGITPEDAQMIIDMYRKYKK